jgi:hypothetical protein
LHARTCTRFLGAVLFFSSYLFELFFSYITERERKKDVVTG